MDPRSGAGRFRMTLRRFSHFATPSAGGGRLFVAAGSKVVALRISILPGPKLSAVRLNPQRFTAQRGTVLSLTLSESTKVRVSITRTLSGRRVRGRCRLHARSGNRCTLGDGGQLCRESARARLGGDEFEDGHRAFPDPALAPLNGVPGPRRLSGLPQRVTPLEEGADAFLDVLGGKGDGQLRAQEVQQRARSTDGRS